MNKELCNKIQDLIMETSPDCIEMNHLIDTEIAKVIETYAETMGEEELEALSDKLVDVIGIATNEAYRTGAKHCLKLIIETIAE